MTQNDEQSLPREVSRNSLAIGGYEIEVVHLDNGQRIVTEEGMEQFIAYLTGEGLLNITTESKP